MATPSSRSAAAATDQQSTTSSVASCLPVFIENTRDLFSFPIEQGAAMKMHHLRTAVAQKLKVHPNTITLKIHRQKVSLDDRLCAVPENTVVQVYTDDERFQAQGDHNTTTSATTPMSTARSNKSRVSFYGSGGGGEDGTATEGSISRHQQDISLYESAQAPTTVKNVHRLPKLDMSKNYAGRQANIDLLQSLRDNNNDKNSSSRTGTKSDFDETRYYVDNESNKSGGGNNVSLSSPSSIRRGSRSSNGTTADPTSPSISLRKPEKKKAKDITVQVSLENGAPTSVTVDLDSTVSDLRVRCNVQSDEYPCVSCDGRRIRCEQRTFKELAIADKDKIIWHATIPEGWEDSSDITIGGINRDEQKKVGSMNKVLALTDVSTFSSNNNNNSYNPMMATNSPSRMSTGRSAISSAGGYQQQHQQQTSQPRMMYNNNNTNQSVMSNVGSFLNHNQQQPEQIDTLNQSTRSESSAYGQAVLSPDRKNVGQAPPSNSSARSNNNIVEPMSPSYLTAPHVSPVTPTTYNTNNNNNNTNIDGGNNNHYSAIQQKLPSNLSYEQQISYYNQHADDNKSFRGEEGKPIVVKPLSPYRIGNSMSNKNFSLVNVNNSARSQAYYNPGSVEESHIQEINTDYTGQSPVRRRGNGGGNGNDNTTMMNNNSSMTMMNDYNNSYNVTISNQTFQQQPSHQARGNNNNNTTTFGGGASPSTNTTTTVMMSPKQRNAALRAKLSAMGNKQQQQEQALSPNSLAGRRTKLNETIVRPTSFANSDNPDVELPDSPARDRWAMPIFRESEINTPEFHHATGYGCYLNVFFEDPTDDNFTHDLRVWSLNPCSFFFSFAGEASEDRYHLLCDGSIVLNPSASFGSITKGKDGCLFSFARKR